MKRNATASKSGNYGESRGHSSTGEFKNYLSDSRTNRWFAGSSRAALNSKRSPSIMLEPPHSTCTRATTSILQHSAQRKRQRNPDHNAPLQLPTIEKMRLGGRCIEHNSRLWMDVNGELVRIPVLENTVDISLSDPSKGKDEKNEMIYIKKGEISCLKKDVPEKVQGKARADEEEESDFGEALEWGHRGSRLLCLLYTGSDLLYVERRRPERGSPNSDDGN